MARWMGPAAIAGMLALAGCGDTDLERGATGAAAGGVAGEVVSGDPVTGALVGGAAGALCDEVGACPD